MLQRFSKDPIQGAQRHSERQRAIVFVIVTSLIVFLVFWEYIYSRHVAAVSDQSERPTTLSLQVSPLHAASTPYHMHSFYLRVSGLPEGKLPPTDTKVIASTPLEAIEIFAKEYSLTVDSVDNNNIVYITRNGVQINTQISAVPRNKSHS